MSTATELLRRALEEIESQDADLRSEFEGFNKIWQGPPIIEEIRAFLAAEPEAEPVAWIQPNHLEKAQFMPFLCRVEPKQRDDFIPLYTRPEPARKPMTDEEIKELCPFTREEFKAGFLTGVRFAEKHHGILEEP